MKKLISYSVLLLLITSSCKTKSNEGKLIKLQGSVFGTTYSIKYFGKTEYQKPIDSLFNAVNKSLSTYLPSSDISRINQNDSTVVVDDLFVEVFKKAKRIYKETNGYFDPTIGKLINAYGFGSKKTKKELLKEEVTELIKLTGFDKVKLKDRKVYKKVPEIIFDVNALAKGYAVDLIARFLEHKNIVNYLVEIGGEIRAGGLKNNKPWKIAIEKPNPNEAQPFQKIIELSNKSMATSGNYRKFKIGKNGEKYVHIINPKTGLAKESNLLSASVISEMDCADVDAYATAFMAMGLKKTKEFLKKHPNLKVILLYVDKKGKTKEFVNYKS